MKSILTLAITLSCIACTTPNVEADDAAFKVIEVQQTGGFAGVNISYRITPDGSFSRKSKRFGDVKGKLGDKDAAALTKAVKAIDWDKLPNTVRNPRVTDDFVYDMHIVVGGKTRRVTVDGTSANKHPQLKTIIQTLNKIQRQRAEK